jgi:hypothetical protein
MDVGFSRDYANCFMLSVIVSLSTTSFSVYEKTAAHPAGHQGMVVGFSFGLRPLSGLIAEAGKFRTLVESNVSGGAVGFYDSGVDRHADQSGGVLVICWKSGVKSCNQASIARVSIEVLSLTTVTQRSAFGSSAKLCNGR